MVPSSTRRRSCREPRLGGENGTIGDVVTVQAGGQLGAGDTTTNIGSLTLNNTPVLGGSVLVKINATKAQADLIMVTGGNPINYGGSLVVSNVGVPLLAGDSFAIFNAATHNGSFSSIVGSPGPGLAYTFTNGIVSVIATAATYSTTVVTTISNNISSGKILTIAWPSSHLGWMLQSQTNALNIGIQPLWFDLVGSDSVTSMNLPVNPTNPAVFYRLKYAALALPANSPTILAVKATNSAVALSWAAPAFARSYNLKRSTTSGGSYTTIINLSPNSYTNTGLANGTTYYYVVSALNYNGESANSAEVSATPVAVPPLVPTGLAAQAAHGLVQLNWTAPGGNPATSYNIKRATTNGGPYTTITNMLATGFADTNIVDGTTYYYVVSGVNSDGEGPNSAQVTGTSTAAAPGVPTGMIATGQYAQVKLTWTTSFGATSYNVKRAITSGGPYTTFTNTIATAVYDTGLANGIPNYYVVSALNGIGESADSYRRVQRQHPYCLSTMILRTRARVTRHRRCRH